MIKSSLTEVYLETKNCPRCGVDHYYARLKKEEATVYWSFRCSKCNGVWQVPVLLKNS